MNPSRLKASRQRKMKAADGAGPVYGGSRVAPTGRYQIEVYSPRFAETARRMRSRGATDAELCAKLEISAETLAVWQRQNVEFAQACVVDDAACLERLKSSLYEQALGRTIVERTIVEEGGKRKITIVKKEMPPDREAAKFLLTNMDPKNWRMRPEPPAAEQIEGELATLVRQISQNRHARIGPVAMHPDEVDDTMLEYYGGVLPGVAKGWKRNPLHNPELATAKKENSHQEE